MRFRTVLCVALASLLVHCGDSPTEPVVQRNLTSFATTTTEDGLSISTDKDDYQPGDVVHFTGYGWQPGDVLDIVLTDDPLTHEPHTWTVDVGADGMFHDSTYVVDEGDVNVSFTLVATSRATGRSLTVNFTDSQPQTVSVTPTPQSVAQGSPGTANYTVTITQNGSATACTMSLSVPGLPLGVSAAFTNGITQFTSNTTVATGLTISTTAAVPASTITITVDVARVANCQGSGTTSGSGTLNVIGAPAKLAFVQQPTNTQSTAAISPAPTVQVQDAAGHPVNSSASIMLAIDNNAGPGGTLSGTNTQAAVSGLATFPGLSIDKAGTGYTLKATSTGLTDATSTGFNITTGPFAKLAFTTQPGGGTEGIAFSQQPVVTSQDAGGNTITTGQGSAVDVALSIQNNPGGGALTCTNVNNTATASGGIAVFAGCKINKAGTGYTLRASNSTAGTTRTVDSDPFNIVSANSPPVANNDVATTNEDTPVEIDVLANDTDDGGTSGLSIVDLTQPAAGKGSVALSSGDKKVTYTPAANFHGTATFTYKVSDGLLQSSAATVTVTVNSVNDLPVLTGVPASPTVDELTEYTFDANATDVDLPAQTLTFSLDGEPTGASINPSTGEFSWTPSEAQGPGTYPFSVKVSDGVGQTSASITITVNEVNVAPTLTDVPPSADIDEMANYTFDANATDPDLPAQTLTFSLVSGPSGAAIDASSGVFSWTPTEQQGPGTYPFKVRVSDGMDATDASITITVREVNLPPVLGSIGPQGGNEGEALTFTATATDPDFPANSLTFSLDGAPAGATINGSTGAFTWTPGDNTVATFKVVVTDNGTPQLTDEESITATILNVPPTISTVTATPSGQLTLGSNNQVTTTVSVAFTDPAGAADEPYTKNISCGNGTNASSSGVCTYTAADVGFRTITATVTDKDGGTSAPKTTQVQVIYHWAGFFQPVDNNNLNVAKAGSAIPVKFNLGGNQGLDIFFQPNQPPGYPNSSKVNCDTNADLDTIEETVNAGQSSLTYDVVAQQYVYVWKSDKTWAGTCRRLDVKLKDGTTHSALFKWNR